MGTKSLKEPKKNLRKIIWAVDATEPDWDLERHAFEVARSLSANHDFVIEPVFVYSPRPIVDYPSESIETKIPSTVGIHYFSHTAEDIQEWRAEGRALLNMMLDELEIAGAADLGEATILIETGFGRGAASRNLADYAEETSAELIVVGTHGRKGVARLVAGSFCEALINISRVPVLAVTTHSHFEAPSKLAKQRERNILFATDLSISSTHTWLQLLDLALAMKARVTLFHTLPVLVGPMQIPMLLNAKKEALDTSSWRHRETDPQTQMLGRLDTDKRRVVNRWLKFAKKRSVPVSVKIEFSFEGVAKSVLHELEHESAQMIAIESHDTPLESAIMGSVTRNLERKAPCPVWVLHRAV